MITERLLPNSQGRFRRVMGVSIRFLWQSSCWKRLGSIHRDSLFMTFIDLKKAYDSMPRSALWSVLVKCGVPPTMLNIIQSIYEGMEASVRVRDGVSDSFEAWNGLR